MVYKRVLSALLIVYKTIACKSCGRAFDKEDKNGYCPFCGTDNN